MENLWWKFSKTQKKSAAELCQKIRIVTIEIVINSTPVMGIRVTISCRYCIAFEVMLLFLVIYTVTLSQKTVAGALYKCYWYTCLYIFPWRWHADDLKKVNSSSVHGGMRWFGLIISRPLLTQRLPGTRAVAQSWSGRYYGTLNSVDMYADQRRWDASTPMDSRSISAR